MWLETDDGPALGLHLGMAGRIVVDPEDSSRWDRFALEFEDGGGWCSVTSAGSGAPCSTPTSPTSEPTPPRWAATSSVA